MQMTDDLQLHKDVRLARELRKERVFTILLVALLLIALLAYHRMTVNYERNFIDVEDALQ